MRIARKLIKRKNIDTVKNTEIFVKKSETVIKGFNDLKSDNFVEKKSSKTREEKLESQIDVASCSYIGRLGNNFFQMAVTLEYGRKYNVPVIFDKWIYDGIEHDASLIFEKDLLFIKYPDDFEWNLYKDPFHYYKPVPYMKNIRFHGFFQSYKYFDEQITKDFFSPNLKHVVNVIYDKYSYIFSKRTTSIHCRRGDYLNNENFYSLSMKYYNEAMQKMNSVTDLYVVFSDDIEWCKHNIISKDKKEMLYIENNPDYIDLFLMSMCDNNIIANSSFSWWGAYLNRNPYKIVITPNPKEWFTPKSPSYDKTFDLCPENWMIMDNT